MNLIPVIRYMTKNPYFSDGRWLTGSAFKGFFLHSVGCAQPDPLVFIRRWDQDSHTSSGINGFIYPGGAYITAPCLETKGKVKRMPHACSPANNNYIGFEMTEPSQLKYNTQGNAFTVDSKDLPAAKAFVSAMYVNAVELFAMLCMFHGKDPLKDGVILSHREGALRGIASNHGDPEFLWRGLGMPYTMDGFRADVANKIKEENNMTEAQCKALIATELLPLKETIAALEKTVAAQSKLLAAIPDTIAKALDKALGKEVKHLADAPAWMRPRLQELLEYGVINGGTPAEVDALDVNKREAILEGLLMAMACDRRYFESLLLTDRDESGELDQTTEE
ncbi:MAG: hypothetical protein IKO68_00035 [Oscillospiraceae bacterium]|nr:hypothetical protein [Oscillospiraceae bacterium]MBR4654983.1 hypothetical protein [Oscillospiraceae bacterium]